jgi:hypothetical protein
MKKLLMASLILASVIACGDNANNDGGTINSDQTTTDTSQTYTDTSQTNMGNTSDSGTGMSGAKGAVPDSLPGSSR